jgi:hypothetical protein
MPCVHHANFGLLLTASEEACYAPKIPTAAAIIADSSQAVRDAQERVRLPFGHVARLSHHACVVVRDSSSATIDVWLPVAGTVRASSGVVVRR